MENFTKENIKMNIHPLLKILEGNFSFFIVSQIMMAMPAFQKSFIDDCKGEMGEVSTSVDFNGFSTLRFSASYIFNEFNKEFDVSEKGGKVKAKFGGAMIRHGRLIAIALFDILYNSIYNKEINKEEIFKFAKHLRNASAHNNKFTFEKKLENNVEWRGKIIEQNLEGTIAFGKFIILPDLMVLINDISCELDKIDARRRAKVKAKQR